MAAAHTGAGAPFSQEEIDYCLTALVAWAGNASAAVRHMEGEDRRTPSASALNKWVRTTQWERYQQIRDRWAQQIEDSLVNDMRDMARLSVEAQRLAVEKAVARLEANADQDPARTAANLSTVARSSTEKMQMLLGRAEKITETRSNPEELLRSLIGMGVLQAPADAEADEEQPALAESAGEER